MMITIHGFPAKTKYQDVKILVKQECNISDFILDSLVNDNDGTKKVRIGLTDNSEGYRLMKCLDCYRLPGGFVLKAVPVGKAAATLPQPDTFESQPGYQNQPRNEYPNVPRNDYNRQPANDYSDQGAHGGPHGHIGPHGSAGPLGTTGPHGPRSSHTQSGSHGSVGHQGGMEPMSRPSPWASGSSNPNQWSSNPPMATQVPQNTFGFNSSQAVNPSFGHQQHHGHPRPEMRPGFNQGRAPDQSYGYSAKSNIPEVPANSRYRWTKIKKTEPELWNLPTEDEDGSSQSSTDSSDDESPSKEAVDSELPQHSSQKTDPGEPSYDSKPHLSKKDRKKLKAADRKRLFWWLKRGKTLKEARELCKTHVKKCPEYVAAREFKKAQSRQKKLQSMPPEARARVLKLEQLQGPPVIKTGPPLRVNIVDELEDMCGEKIDKLHDKILDLIEAEVEENRPNISRIGQRFGYLFVACANENSMEWLKKSLSNVELWEGARFNVFNSNEIPKSIIGVAFIPNPNLDEYGIFNMLKLQNPEMDFNEWRITGSKMLPPNGQTVTFNISHNSIKDLAEKNYNLHFGFKKIKIKIKSKTVVPGLGKIGPVPSPSTSASAHRRPPVVGKTSKQHHRAGAYGAPFGNDTQTRSLGWRRPPKQNNGPGGSNPGNGTQRRPYDRVRPPKQNRQQGGPRSGNVMQTQPPGGGNPPNQNSQGPHGKSGKRKKNKSKSKKSKNNPGGDGFQGNPNPDGLWNNWGTKREPS